MIVADRKPIDEIIGYLKDHKNILILGCNECVTVCEAGGKKEVGVLASALRMHAQKEGTEVKIDEVTLERQCDREYLDEIRDSIDQYDAVVSLACGVGVQFMSEQYHNTPVYPGVNTCLWGPPKNGACGPNAARAAVSVSWRKPGASARWHAVPSGFSTAPAVGPLRVDVRLMLKSTAPGN